MNSIWRLVFRNISGGQKSRHVLLKSLALAFPAALLAIPYFYFLLFDFPRKGGAIGLGNAQAIVVGPVCHVFYYLYALGNRRHHVHEAAESAWHRGYKPLAE